MSHLIPNSFSSYFMLEEDIVVNSVFTLGQVQVLQNLLAVKAEEKLALTFDVSNPSSYIQQAAYHDGQIELLKYLLDNSLACQQMQYPSDSDITELP
jgi:hypothetical protein